jgi:DNA-binding NarL/FixJ family response regulator
VLVAASQALVGAGYPAVLERDEAIEVVAEAAGGQRALELISHHPDMCGSHGKSAAC